MIRYPPLSVAMPLLIVGLAVVVLSPGQQPAQYQSAAPAESQAAPARPSYIAASLSDALLKELQAPSATPPAETAAATTTQPTAPAAPALAKASLAPEPSLPTVSHLDRVGDSAVNVRAGPSASTAKLFVLQPGERVTVTETVGGWAQIVNASGEGGWVSARYLADGTNKQASPRAVATATPDSPRLVAAAQKGRVTQAAAVRAGPSRSAPRLFVLEPGERVVVAEKRGRWIRIILDSGASAWIDSRDPL